MAKRPADCYSAVPSFHVNGSASLEMESGRCLMQRQAPHLIAHVIYLSIANVSFESVDAGSEPIGKSVSSQRLRNSSDPDDARG